MINRKKFSKSGLWFRIDKQAKTSTCRLASTEYLILLNKRDDDSDDAHKLFLFISCDVTA